MQQEDDLVSLAKVIHLIRAVSIIILTLHFYWFCYEAFCGWGLTFYWFDNILESFQRSTGMFTTILYTKIISFGLLIISVIGTRSVKKREIRWRHITLYACFGLPLFWLNGFILSLPGAAFAEFLYIITTISGFLLCMVAGILIGRLLYFPEKEDPFNYENESFRQEQNLIANDFSVNLPTRFYHDRKYHDGYINVINPFRSTLVLGSPGSGKSFAVINNYIKQHIEKGFSMYLYDFKFDDLSKIAYNHLLKNLHNYKTPPKFYVINMDDPRYSHRCNPIHPKFMSDPSDAFESSHSIMIGLNKTWAEKMGDFFIDSPIVLLAAIIWFLKIYKDGKYCTFPHAIELLCQPYSKVFNILSAYPELSSYMSAFRDAMLNGAQEQLQGQIASAKIPLSKIVSPRLFWIMSGDDFTLDLNNPEEPKILCVGNNPDKMTVYSAALSLYNSRIVRLINKKKKLKCSIIVDELATLYFKNLDQLIATARSNKISVCLGLQDFSQLERDYGQKEAEVIKSICGNLFSGLVLGDTARELSDKFGKIVQQRESISVADSNTTTSVNTQLDSLIPASKISTLSQGSFVGVVADNFGEKIEQKFFNAEIVIDVAKLKEEEKNYIPIPQITEFLDEEGNDNMDYVVKENFYRIKNDVITIVKDEETRIKNDPDLKHLFPEKKQK